MSKPRKLAPIHPGEVLYQDFMKPTATSINRLALKLHVPVTRVAGESGGFRSVVLCVAQPPPAGEISNTSCPTVWPLS